MSSIYWPPNTDQLIPAIVQDAQSGLIVMQGYMNQEALMLTLENGYVTFFSRSKNRIWQKGETSNNKLKYKNHFWDCDEDSLLILAEPMGPTCHKGINSCFNYSSEFGFTQVLQKIVTDSVNTGGYTQTLFQMPIHKIAQKVGEEGVEVALAATSESSERVSEEIADLIYHLTCLLNKLNIPWKNVAQVLALRAKK